MVGTETATLSLLQVAKLTWPKVPDTGEATFEDYCKFLYNHREDIWIICSGSNLEGMVAAKNTAGRLYVTILVTLTPDCFENFISRANEFWGEIKTLAYKRRGKLVERNFNIFRRKAIQ